MVVTTLTHSLLCENCIRKLHGTPPGTDLRLPCKASLITSIIPWPEGAHQVPLWCRLVQRSSPTLRLSPCLPSPSPLLPQPDRSRGATLDFTAVAPPSRPVYKRPEAAHAQLIAQPSAPLWRQAILMVHKK